MNQKTLRNATIKCNYGVFHDDITRLEVDVLGQSIIVTGYAVRAKINVIMSVDSPQVWNPESGEYIGHLQGLVESS